MMWQYGLMQSAQDVNHLEGRATSPAFFVGDRFGYWQVFLLYVLCFSECRNWLIP